MSDLRELIVEHTNIYHTQNNADWEDTIMEEMKTFMALCMQMSVVKAHPLVLPSGDACGRDERVEIHKDCVKKNCVHYLKMNGCYLEYSQNHVAPKRTPRPILEISLSRCGRCIR
ncbi:hypothetical protein KIN20_037977 [Parelaphostrongylus tenuis]|uniref:Uncharacterized protein n=1 Tax=Parelaphostrongylus tenuis TaxID=148309 RepID=A0AAD5REL8_PARTN|nr:hypothetical protein KIN20_037977 [Parelaphostrongylus tenuis]